MKDSEIRGLVLLAFYEKRHLGFRPWNPSDVPNVEAKDFYRIAEQLAQQNLLEWRGIENGSGTVCAGAGQINANGVDVVEGTAQSPISINFDNSQTVTIHGSNNFVGNNNQLSFENIDLEISQSNFSEAEKAEAKSLLQKVSENKLLNTIIGSAVGELTKAALPK